MDLERVIAKSYRNIKYKKAEQISTEAIPEMGMKRDSKTEPHRDDRHDQRIERPENKELFT